MGSSKDAHYHIVYRGNQSAPQTLVFFHGWPDTDAVFQKQYDAFGDDYRIATLSLPGYRPGSPSVPFPGFSFDQLADKLYTTITQEVMKGRTEKPILISHDWGAVFSYTAVNKYPDLCDKLVGMEVGADFDLLLVPFKTLAFVFVYQLALVLSFLFPHFIGRHLALWAAWFFGASDRTACHTGMSYPYYQYWKGTLTRNLPQCWLRFVPLPPQCKVLFLYGLDKPYVLYTQRFLDHMKTRPGGKAVGMRGGHWFFRDRSAKEANEELWAFLTTP